MKQVTHNIGNIYRVSNSGAGYYILTSFFLDGKGMYAMLVNTTNGGRWHDPVKVEDMVVFTDKEFDEISGKRKMHLVKEAPCHWLDKHIDTMQQDCSLKCD